MIILLQMCIILQQSIQIYFLSTSDVTNMVTGLHYYITVYLNNKHELCYNKALKTEIYFLNISEISSMVK